MKLFSFSEPVEHEDLIPGMNNPWGNDALLIRVNKGMGKLSFRYGHDNNGETYGFLLLDQRPLINSYGELLYCPTCAKVLSIGLGKENVNQSIVDIVKQGQQLEHDIKDAFESLKPMLSLLENGYYLLTRVEMYPTDGEGNFFWNLSSSRKTYQATADVFYKYHHGSGTPKFLLPSQSMHCLNKERVKDYIDQIKNGKTMTGLTYYYDGFMSTLLDGHHRATAAYLENKSIDCLTIIKISGFGLDENNKPDKFFAGGQYYQSHVLRNHKRFYNYLNKINSSRNTKLEVHQVESILKECQHYWLKESNIKIEAEFERTTYHYPDYLSIAFSDMAGDVSDERICEVMGMRDDEAEFELEMIFKKLQIDEPKRAFELAKKILNDPNWKVLFKDVFLYLATIDSTEVEDIFISYFINNEFDSKDSCRKIADEYLSKRQ